MKTRFAGLTLLLSLVPAVSHGVVYFEENFDRGEAPYSFGWYKFGYTDDPIQTFHDSSGGVNNSGTHRIPLGGPSRTNFDVHFGKILRDQNGNYLSAYYVRYYLWVNSTFNTNPAANWKLTYNYDTDDTNFVFWMRPTSDGRGFQPAFFSSSHNADIMKTNASLPTFYLSEYKAQWICFEYYVRLGNPGQVKLWITTQDGRYREALYIDAPFRNAGTAVGSFKLGAYWDGTGDSNYFKLDELVVSDQYIGPIGGTGIEPPPDARLAAPENLSIID